MIKGKLMWLWIVTLVVLLVVGVAVASLKYNASPQAIELTLSISGVNSSHKCTTNELLHDLVRTPVVEAFPRTIIDPSDDSFKVPL